MEAPCLLIWVRRGLIAIKNESGLLLEVFSCEFCEIFKNTCFYRIPPVAASILALVILKDSAPIAEYIVKMLNGTFLELSGILIIERGNESLFSKKPT